MKSLIRSFALCTSVVALMCASVATVHAAGKEIKIGVAAEPYPPFTSKDSSGKWNGFEVDLVNAICANIKATCKIQETAWDGIIPALTSKKIDVIFSSMSITPEREKTIAFSIPYYFTDAGIYGSKKIASKDIKPAALKGKVIGVQTSTTHADFLSKNYKDSTVKQYNTQDEVNADLAAGRIDYMMADTLAIEDFLASKEGANMELKGLAPRDPLFGPGIGAGFRRDDAALKKQFDAAIKQIYASGDFKKMAAKYFKVDISAK